MRISLLALILLFLPAVKIKDACKTRNRHQRTHEHDGEDNGPIDERPLLPVEDYPEQRLDEQLEQHDDVDNSDETHHTPPLFDLLIIGLGVQGKQALDKFSEWEYQHETKFRIGVVETKSKFGPGLPYDEDEVFPEHLEHFAQAVDKKPYLDKYFERPKTTHKFLDAYDRVVLSPPPPRYAEGRHLVHEFNESVKKCEQNGYEIELMPRTTAVNIVRLSSGGYTVTLTGYHQGNITTMDIVLSTGHWYLGRLDPDVDGYFESPWPASRLNETVEAVHVGIGGNGLSANDVAVALAPKFGTLEYEFKFKRFRYTIKPEYQGLFTMTMYSRSGHFPPVAGLQLDKRYFPNVTFAQEAMTIQKSGIGSNKFVPLDDVLKFLKDDLAALIPEISKNNDHFFEMGPEELIQHINFFTCKKKDSMQRLTDDIRAARRSVTEGTPLLLVSFFSYAEEFFRVYLEHFSAEDTLTFKKHIAPAISKWFAPLQPHNAEKMLALMKAGCLFLKAVGNEGDLVPHETSKGVRILHKGRYIYHRYFIDALGQSGDVTNDPSPLTQKLIANGLIQPLYIAYNDTERGKSDMEKHKEKYPDSDMIIEGEDNLVYHRTDGIVLNWKTMHAIPVGEDSRSVMEKASKGVIYAFGPFAYRRFGLYQAIRAANELAGIAVADIRGRRF